MANAAKKDAAHEVPQKDFAGAIKIYREDIKAAATKVGEYAQEQSTAYKAIKKNCHIQPAAAKLAFKLDAMEEAHRDDFLRCLHGLMTELKIFIPPDLVDQAEGISEPRNALPTGERAKPKLATLGGKPAEEPAAGTGAAAIAAMNAAGADTKGDDFEEATPEELAQQEGRPERSDDAEHEETAEAAE